MHKDYLDSSIKQFLYYKLLAEKTIDQLEEKALFLKPNEASNSIAIIMNHLCGNILSRWSDFLTSDGEKEWRKRDEEFEDQNYDKAQLLKYWNDAWKVLFETLESLKEEDLDKIIYIRNMGHTVVEAINRQLCHYSYHIGQIVFIGKMYSTDWKSLSIEKGNSKTYNKNKFSQQKSNRHFTEEFVPKKK